MIYINIYKIYMSVCVTYIICIYSHTIYISFVIDIIYTYIYTISMSFSQFRFSWEPSFIY